MIRLRSSKRWFTAASVALVGGLATLTSGALAHSAPDLATPTCLAPGVQVTRLVPTASASARKYGFGFPARALKSWRSRSQTEYSAEVVRTWHTMAAVQPTNPVRQSRVLAMVHAAIHDAVNGAVPRYRTYASWLSDPSADPEAAAAAAAHRVLVNLFPANTAAFDAQLASSLASIPDGTAEDAGVALGSAVGQSIVNFRVNDGMDLPDPFNPTPGPGVWEPTPPAFAAAVEPQMQNVTPFTIRSRTQFDVEPPPALVSPEYARDYNEVKAVGQTSSTLRADDQTHAAHFWFEASNVGWSRIAAIYTLQNGTGLHDTARLFALLNMAMADGYVAGFYWKRTHAFWRPITAIRKAETDGNPETDPDPAWTSLRPTPPSADYPSTHSVLGTAAAQILRHFTGSDRFSFCMVSNSAEPAGSVRCYNRFSEAAAENADSRVYIGYHFRFATTAGMRLGRQIGNFAYRHNLEPLRPRRW